jgi:hypothetical protein
VLAIQPAGDLWQRLQAGLRADPAGAPEGFVVGEPLLASRLGIR